MASHFARTPPTSIRSFLRNRVRDELLPGLERDYNPRLRQALAETAEIAAAEDAFLDDLVSSVLGGDLPRSPCRAA